MNALHGLSDAELLTELKTMARQERAATARFIAHLAVVDARRLHLPEDCSSMFTCCTQVLHYSERAACARIEVARAVRRFPVILARLAEGALNLTTVGLLSPQLTVANHREILDAAAHGSRRQVEELVARLRPLPAPPTRQAAILPLAPEYYRLQVTLRAEPHARLRQAQELLRHQVPNGDPAETLDRALRDLVEKLSRRKFAALTRPRAGSFS